MASKTDKPYTYHKSPRLAMILEDIKKLIANILRKKRDTPEPQTFEDSVRPPPLTIYTIRQKKNVSGCWRAVMGDPNSSTAGRLKESILSPEW